MLRTEEAFIASGHASRYPSIPFGLLAVVMLATPVILFAIGVAKNSMFLVDGSGALFGIDTALLLWLRDQWARALERHALPPT